jgi:predicted TIM-barrel fold metal-dependent hydrolase
MKIIDTHAHLWRDPQGLDRVAESGQIEQVWLMHVSYYQGSALKDLASDKEILEVARRYPGLFIPFGCIDFEADPGQIDRMKDQGFVGLKAIRPRLPYDDPAYLPIYERAAVLRMPILFHVGIILKNRREEMTPAQSLGPTNMRPSMLDGIAAAFPELPLIAGHMGLPWLNELFEALYYYPNIFCSLCGYVDYRWLMDNLDRRCSAGIANETLSRC